MFLDHTHLQFRVVLANCIVVVSVVTLLVAHLLFVLLEVLLVVVVTVLAILMVDDEGWGLIFSLLSLLLIRTW